MAKVDSGWQCGDGSSARPPTHDSWFPDARPLAFGQVYATLGRLQRDGLVEVVDTGSEGAAERTVYALTEPGRARLEGWLAEPAPPGDDEIVRMTVAALRTGTGAAGFVSAQRAAHLQAMRELTAAPHVDDVAARLGREHALAHLDADLRWLEEAVRLVEGASDRACEVTNQHCTAGRGAVVTALELGGVTHATVRHPRCGA